MGSTITVTTKIDHRYLMNKTKHELCLLIDMILDQLDDYQKAEEETCSWKVDYWGLWEGSCGTTWEFDYDGPEENEMNFCPKCGKRLVILKQEED